MPPRRQTTRKRAGGAGSSTAGEPRSEAEGTRVVEAPRSEAEGTRIVEARIPTPLVVASACGMAAVGIVAFWWSQSTGATPDDAPSPGEVVVDDSTPERAAESFLDAWRKRQHDAARELSVGAAREAVDQRAGEDARLTPEEREVKERVWDTMATSRLRLQITESENLEGGALALRGTADGEFVNRPYEREVAFVLREDRGAWRVAEVSFGEILSDTPDVLELGDGTGGGER